MAVYYTPKGRFKRKKRRRRKRPWRGLIFLPIAVICMLVYRNMGTYTIGLDAGHGGTDTGAAGMISEVELTERTTAFLEGMLKADGRFRVILSRDFGEGKSIGERNRKLRKKRPDIVLSIHGNADPMGKGRGFECYPSPPGRGNYGESYGLARIVAEEMAGLGSIIRGNDGIRYGYYIPDQTGQLIKTIKESSDTTIYGYGSFGMVEKMNCPAVLVEQCFVTNAEDVAAFGTEEGCKKAAGAYYRAICRYLRLD